MKMKTSELTGAALDWAVGRETFQDVMIGASGTLYIVLGHTPVEWKPSTNWAQGGPIVEEYGISVSKVKAIKTWHWVAGLSLPSKAPSYGPTPLVAAMRAYISLKLGNEIEIPEELCQPS